MCKKKTPKQRDDEKVFKDYSSKLYWKLALQIWNESASSWWDDLVPVKAKVFKYQTYQNNVVSKIASCIISSFNTWEKWPGKQCFTKAHEVLWFFGLVLWYPACVCKISQVILSHYLRMVSTNRHPGTKKDNVDCDQNICSPLRKANSIKLQAFSARFFSH